MSSAPSPDAGSPPKRPVGRPRDASTDRRILAAALAELAQNGIAHFSVPAVARRVGVARGTVDLRWPDREDLIAAALETTAYGFTTPDTGTMRGDVTELVHQWADVFRDGQISRVVLRMRAESEEYPDLFGRYVRTVAEPARALAIDAIRRVQERADADAAISAEAIVHCMLGALLNPPHPTSITPDYEAAVVETLVAALTPRA